MSRILILLFFFLLISCFAKLYAQSGKHYVEIADSLYENDEYQPALDNYNKAIPFYQGDKKLLSDLYVSKTKCERRLKLYPQAITHANLALTLNPKNGEAYWSLAAIYGDNGNHKLSIENYTKAMPFYQKNAESLSMLYDNRSYEELALNLNKEAAKDDSLAINLDEENENAYLHRGVAFTKIGDFQHVVENYSIAISHEVDSVKLADLYNKRGVGEYELKNYLESINDESNAIKLNSRNGLFFWFRGIAHSGNGDYQLSIDDYTTALNFVKNKNNPAIASLYRGRAINEVDLQRFDDAINDYNIALKLDSSVDSYSGLALAYTNSGEFQAGVDNYINAIAFCKDDKITSSSYYGDCAENEYYLKNYKKVIEYCTQAIALYPSHVSPYYYLGKVYLKILDKKDLAFQNFKRGMEIDTSKKSDTFIFSLFYTGNTDQAYKKMHDRLLSETKDEQLVSNYYSMACLLSLMDKKQEANSYLKQAIDSGYSKKYALADDDLDNIRDTQEFKETLANGGKKQ